MLISLASLLGIEGSASATTKMHAARQVYENAPCRTSLSSSKVTQTKTKTTTPRGCGVVNLEEQHELFVRSAIAVSMMSMGNVGVAASRIFSEVVREWKNVLETIVDTSSAPEVFNLLCTMQLCLVTCIGSTIMITNGTTNNAVTPTLMPTEDIYIAVHLARDLCCDAKNTQDDNDDEYDDDDILQLPS